MSSLDRLFKGMHISATGLSAERARIDVIAENLANAQTTRTPSGGPYRRRVVVFEPLLQRMMDGSMQSRGVRAARIEPDMTTPFERIHDPGHPDADADGFVEMPNVNTTREMADLMTALRAYEANLTASDSLHRMAERALELAR